MPRARQARSAPSRLAPFPVAQVEIARAVQYAVGAARQRMGVVEPERAVLVGESSAVEAEVDMRAHGAARVGRRLDRLEAKRAVIRRAEAALQARWRRRPVHFVVGPVIAGRIG